MHIATNISKVGLNNPHVFLVIYLGCSSIWT